MLPNLFRQTQRLLSPHLLLVAAVFLLTFVSCKKENKYPVCVQLSKVQIQKWVNKGYIKPNDSTTIVRFKVAYAWPGTIYRVYAVIQDKNGSSNNKSLIELKPVDTCGKSHIHLDDFVFEGTMQARLADWNIWKKDGINDSLQYIQFVPYDYAYEGLSLLALHDYIIKKGGIPSAVIHPKSEDGLLPCPPCPNCKSCPPPTSCTDCGSVAIDSTK